MIWQNPWAWAGLSVLVLPLLIHLFSRRQAQLQPFPTLRFLDASRLLATRRTRVSDLLLLLVRLGVLAAATAAIAQPLWLSSGRRRARESTLARVIVVDTSPSMRRMVPAGATTSANGNVQAVDEARTQADHLAGEATTASIVMTSEPRQALAGAVAWLRTRSGRGEVVIVSDFQTGVIDSLDLKTVPVEFGVMLVRVAVSLANETAGASTSVSASTNAGAPIVTEIPSGDQTLRATTTLTPEKTVVAWRLVSAPHDTSAHDVQLLATPDEQLQVQRAMRAVKAIGGAMRVNARWPVFIVFPGYPERAPLLAHGAPLDSLWMVRVVTRMRADRAWLNAADGATVVGAGNGSAVATPLTPERGVPVAVAMRADVQGRTGLVIMANVDAGSVAAAALIDATARAAFDAPSVSEQDPATLNASVLRAWERAPSTRASTGLEGAETGESDARWFWVIVLALLALESWMRRVRPNENHAAVALDVAG